MKTLSFVIPVYNEQERINKTFNALTNVKLPRGLKLTEVIFVNDGSVDKTAKLIEAFAKKAKLKAAVKLVTYTTNRGKGYALKQGMLKASGDYTLFFDADMSTPLSELAKFKPFMDKNIQVLIGTRKNGHSTVTKHQPLMRELLGKGFTKMTQIALSIDNTDFTCGFKAFSKKSKDAIFPESQIDRWGYDAEILLLARKFGFSQREIAVEWANDERTRVKLVSAIISTFSELGTIVWMHRLKPTLNTILPTSLLTRLNLIK